MNRYTWYLIAAMLLVGSNVGIGKSLVVAIPVDLLALLRFAIAVCLMAPAYRASALRRLSRHDWFVLTLQAGFGTFLFTVLVLAGAARTTAVSAGVITSTIPAMVAILSWAFLRERPECRTVVSIMLAIAGVVLITLSQCAGSCAGLPDGAPAGAEQWWGNLLVLGAVCCEAIYVILSRRLAQSLGAFEVCALTHLLCLLMTLPFGLAAAWQFDWSSLTWPILGELGWYTVSASIFSYWLWMKGVRHIAGPVAGVFTAMIPIAAAAYGIAFLDEVPTASHGIAFACVVAGVLLASVGKRRPTIAQTAAPSRPA